MILIGGYRQLFREYTFESLSASLPPPESNNDELSVDFLIVNLVVSSFRSSVTKYTDKDL